MSFVIIQGILFFFKYEEIIRGKVFKWEKEETEHGWQTSNQHTYSLTLFFFPPSLSLFLSFSLFVLPHTSLCLPLPILHPSLFHLSRANWPVQDTQPARLFRLTPRAAVGDGCCRERAGKICEMQTGAAVHMQSSERSGSWGEAGIELGQTSQKK